MNLASPRDDVGLADANGLLLIAGLRATAPATRIIVVSGFNDPLLNATALKEGAHFFLPKPLDLTQLDRLLKQIADERDSS